MRRHSTANGAKARRWFVYWCERQRDLLFVVRDGACRPAGWMPGIILEEGDMQIE